MLAPGDLVVCVDDAFKKQDESDGLRKGVVYTIREWLPSYRDHHPRPAEDAVRLAEIRRHPCVKCGFEDSPFAARRFRPITRDRLELFRSILRDAPVDDKEHA